MMVSIIENEDVMETVKSTIRYEVRMKTEQWLKEKDKQIAEQKEQLEEKDKEILRLQKELEKLSHK